VKFDYDLIVIGGGSGGLVASKFARGIGKKVLLIEKNKLGGECTWTGCVPSKTMVKSAYVAKTVHDLHRFGLLTKNDIELDFQNVMQHVKKVVLEVYQTHTPEKIEEAGIDLLFGSPQFIDAHTIQVDQKKLTAKNFIITTGSHPYVPPIKGIETVAYETNETIFNRNTLPKSIVILGGGAIGAEMASALIRLGAKVTIVEMQDRILVKEDEELVYLITEHFKKQGIEIRTGLKCVAVAQQGKMISVTCEDQKNVPKKIEAELLLIAVGRRPNLEGLLLERAGVQTTKHGIKVNKKLRTTAKNIYACGDVVGPYLFSHMAFYQAVIATRNALIPFFKQSVDYKNVIWVTFTGPPLATAGLTERAAREKYGDSILIYRKPYKALDRAYTDGTLEGMGKFICDKRGKIIGAHIFGADAGEIIHEVQLGKTYNIPFADFYKVIHAYPTYSELIWHAARKAYLDRLQKNIVIRFAKYVSSWFSK